MRPEHYSDEETLNRVYNSNDATDVERDLARRLDFALLFAEKCVRRLQENGIDVADLQYERFH